MMGESVTFTVNPGGATPFFYQWFKDGAILNGATNDNYHIASCTSANSGVYSCQVTNACGNIKSNISTLVVGSGIVLYGYVTYDNNSATVMTKTTVKLRNYENTFSDQITTDSLGYYQFKALNSGNYIITGETAKTWGGGDPTDALIISKVFVKMMSFADNLKKKAADVNLDNRATSTDALIINKRFVKLISSFVAGNWVFNIDSLTLTADIQHDFKGLCVGDVNGSYTPPLAKLIPDINLVNDSYVSASKNGIVDLPFRINENIGLGAIGIILNVNNPDVKIIGFSTDIDDVIYNFNSNSLALAWSALNKNLELKANDIMFKVKVQLSGSALNNPLSDIFRVSPLSILSDPSANNYSNRSISYPFISSLYSVKNYPNPFNNITNFEYNLPNSSRVSLKVFNLLGVQIADLINAEQEQGVHYFAFDGSDLPAGVYIYKFEAVGKDATFNKSDLIILSR